MQVSFASSTIAADSTEAGKLQTLNQTGLEHYRQHNYTAAETTFKTALDEAYNSNDQSWVGTILSNLSAVYSAQGKTSDADRLSLEARSIKNKVAGITMRPAAPKVFARSPAATNLVDLNGYVSETQTFKGGAGKRSILSLQPQFGIMDPSVPRRIKSTTSSRTANGGIEWGPWPEAKLPPPEPFQPQPPEGFPPQNQFPGVPPYACVPCQERNEVLINIHVQGLGALFGPPGGAPRGGGLFNLFNYSETFSAGGY
jgi:hypothetical protein